MLVGRTVVGAGVSGVGGRIRCWCSSFGVGAGVSFVGEGDSRVGAVGSGVDAAVSGVGAGVSCVAGVYVLVQ